MTVVVTGATGFIGRALVLRLLGEGRRVIALARDANLLRIAREDLDGACMLNAGGNPNAI